MCVSVCVSVCICVSVCLLHVHVCVCDPAIVACKFGTVCAPCWVRVLQLYQLLFTVAKAGGKSAVQDLCDAGIARTFANLDRSPNFPQYVWDAELHMPVLLLLKLLASSDPRRLVDIANQGCLSLAFTSAVAAVLAKEPKLAELGACVCVCARASVCACVLLWLGEQCG